MIRLLIVDDHTLMREGLKQLFALVEGIYVVADATNGAQALECLRKGGIDLVLLDLSMPGMSGEALIKRIRIHYPQLRILVLSMHNEPQVAKRAIKAGANGFACKDSSSDALLEAIRKVAAGGRYLEPVIAEKMAFEAAGVDITPHHEILSDRELQVLRLLAKGKSINAIADELHISNKTVSTHKARMMDKMGFTNNTDLVRYAITNGLA
ncbi:response regulator [Nitrincola sp.]|uniref:response regulator n=1 Tax=Nitrincola sp. TaxID=1926584 RepID=UPI003A90934D